MRRGKDACLNSELGSFGVMDILLGVQVKKSPLRLYRSILNIKLIKKTPSNYPCLRNLKMPLSLLRGNSLNFKMHLYQKSLSVMRNLAFAHKVKEYACSIQEQLNLGQGFQSTLACGLLSLGHPVNASGARQIAELTWQLRGQVSERQVPSAKVGLADMLGGTMPLLEGGACGITILAR